MKRISAKKRLLSFFPTLLGVSFLLFVLIRLAPGDPVYVMVGPRASEDVIERYRQKLHLDKPIIIQYAYYMKAIFSGDFGRSYYTKEPVFKSILEKLPRTFTLAFLSMIIGALTGITFGVLASLKKGSFIDKFFSAVSTLFISTPVFWTAIMLIFIFSVVFKLLPASNIESGSIISYLLPAFVLGSRSAGYIARLARSSMLDAFSSPYIYTARAKGAGKFRIIMIHAFKNCLIPIITLIGLDFGSYLNGSVLTESIFGIDGMGRLAINAILKRDMPVIVGTVLTGAFVFMTVNLIVDLIYIKIDPRVKS